MHVITYNMALLPLVTELDPSRPSKVDELCRRIEAEQPDVVGLCEVFIDQWKDDIANRLKHLYGYRLDGPDEVDFAEQDGGLLLLSRHPITASTTTIYRDSAGMDAFANKGVIHARIEPPGSMPVDVFFTHMQDEDAGRGPLRHQLDGLGAFVASIRDPNLPALLFGDLNVAAGDAELYADAMAFLAPGIDLWATQRPIPSPENTYIASTSRLDYVILYPGLTHDPILAQMDILRWTRDEMNISDHYGLRAKFEQMVVMEPGDGPVNGVRVNIATVHCLSVTDGGGNDDVTFELTATATQSGTSATHEHEVESGDAFHTPESPIIELAGDPGPVLTLHITGAEHDDVRADVSLGARELTIPHWYLAQYRGRSFTRSMFLNGAGSEYVVTIRIAVY